MLDETAYCRDIRGMFTIHIVTQVLPSNDFEMQFWQASRFVLQEIVNKLKINKLSYFKITNYAVVLV